MVGNMVIPPYLSELRRGGGWLLGEGEEEGEGQRKRDVTGARAQNRLTQPTPTRPTSHLHAHVLLMSDLVKYEIIFEKGSSIVSIEHTALSYYRILLHSIHLTSENTIATAVQCGS
jgi:hypothetical protein